MFQKKSLCGLVLIGICLIGKFSANAQGTEHLPPCTSENHGIHYPSGFDCRHYFTCFNGQYTLQQCNDDPFIWFDFEQQGCSMPELVSGGCEFETTTSTTTVSTPRPNPVDCPLSNELPVNVAHPMSCTRYFMCFAGVAVERSCSPGLYFSRSQLRCVRREDSDCLLDLDSCPLENDPNNIVFLPDQEDCQKYFVCFDGEPIEKDCGDTLHWEPTDNWCIKEEDSECEPNYPLPDIREIECPDDTEGDIIFIPHPEECQFYFICLDGVSLLARCARNLLFDYILRNCYFADRAQCFDPTVPEFLRLR